MRLKTSHFKRRVLVLLYLFAFVWFVSYVISGRIGWWTEVILEKPDEEALLRTWPFQMDGKLVVPMDDQGKIIRLNANETSNVRHPMYHLIMDAERKWNAMVRRQSRTLKDAVDEYQQRYNRLPPKGFDEWYNSGHNDKPHSPKTSSLGVYIKDDPWLSAQNEQLSSNLQYTIQYDQIDRDIIPFLALSPETAQKLRDVLSEQDSKWFLKTTITGGVTEIWDDRDIHRSVHRLTGAFEKQLPDMTWYTHLHDMGPYTIDQGLRDEAKKALLAGTYITLLEIKQFENPHRNTRRGVLKGCRDDAPSLLEAIDPTLKPSPPPRNQTSFEFIYDHRTTMDICYNQALFENQCLFNGNHPRDARLRPLFVQSKTVHGGGIITPSEYGFKDTDGQIVTPWEERSPKVFWRGSNTGNCPPQHIKNGPRVRLHLVAQNRLPITADGTLKILSENPKQSDEGDDTDPGEGEGESGLQAVEVSMEEFNAKFMDVGVTVPALQCGDKKNCAEFEKEVGLLPRVNKGSRGEENKYTIDVGKFFLLCVVFKSTNFPDWNTDRMMPYYHYVPIQHDFSDLYNSVAFFTGTPSGRGAHDAMAKRIGSNAVEYVRKHWRREDMEAYVYRLLLEYARMMSPDRDATSYHPPESRPL
ncbi:Glycosyltransferase Family 90 domain containing protein [Tulasnella sp. 332]|nr:Glycosyltransferase Family 90 domain containing protein [Tulasnella sp. 332]